MRCPCSVSKLPNPFLAVFTIDFSRSQRLIRVAPFRRFQEEADSVYQLSITALRRALAPKNESPLSFPHLRFEWSRSLLNDVTIDFFCFEAHLRYVFLGVLIATFYAVLRGKTEFCSRCLPPVSTFPRAFLTVFTISSEADIEAFYN